MTTTIQDLAAEARDYFERRERTDGESYMTLRDDRPAWVQDLVREAHGDMFPNDWRYVAIHDALERIEDGGVGADLDEIADEYADEVDVYTGELISWMASHGQRPGYCDEAADEGLVEPDADMSTRMMAGQSVERREVFQAVRAALDGRLRGLELAD